MLFRAMLIFFVVFVDQHFFSALTAICSWMVLIWTTYHLGLVLGHSTVTAAVSLDPSSLITMTVIPFFD